MISNIYLYQNFENLRMNIIKKDKLNIMKNISTLNIIMLITLTTMMERGTLKCNAYVNPAPLFYSTIYSYIIC